MQNASADAVGIPSMPNPPQERDADDSFHWRFAGNVYIILFKNRCLEIVDSLSFLELSQSVAPPDAVSGYFSGAVFG